MDIDINKRYQTLIILWFAMLMNIAIFFVISMIAVPTDTESSAAPARVMMFLIAAAAAFVVVLSFAVKRKLLERSVENQDVAMVQKALIIACALCEVAALLGVVERMVLRNNDYYLLFGIAIIGTALHFPRKEQLEAATYKMRAQDSI